MLLERIEENLKKIESNLDKDNFIYQFLEAYDQPKSSIKRLKDGDYNLSKKQNEVIWKKKIHYYQVKDDEDVHACIDELSKSESVIKNKIRFIIVTDFKDFLSVDLKNNSTLDIKILELSKNVDFFLPLCGIEKFANIEENLADIKAAETMGKLYDLLITDNPKLKKDTNKLFLNIFFSRILFCFFAEDTEIFDKNIFTNSIASFTLEDGSDLDQFIHKLFKYLGSKNFNNAPNYLKKFPYVNGELFSEDAPIPKFNKETRKLLISLGDLNWNEINPDILGSMMQAVVNNGFRKDLGMHYTSVSNILKLIKPQFLDDLIEKVNLTNDEKKLKKILNEIYELRFIDPACGSGNFLVVTYKELCKVELEIYKKLKSIDDNNWLLLKSNVQLQHFYGLEIDDFAHQSAKLSLWIAQHQMNILFKEVFGETKPTLPLSPSGHIYCINAARVNWYDFFKKKLDTNKNIKIIIFGNPPYGGHDKRTDQQKVDFEHNPALSTKLDYISIWFFKAAEFLSNYDASVSFVTTRSICTGEQVEKLWPHLLKNDINISFAYKPFWWKNNAKYNATVMCTIIGLENLKGKTPKIYDQSSIISAKVISPYLVPNVKSIVKKVSNYSISKSLPKILFGNMARDNGYLILSDEEKNKLVCDFPNCKKFIRRLIGGKEFLKGQIRWCLWINENNLSEAMEVEFINDRLKNVEKYRAKSKNNTTKRFSKYPYKFVEIRHQEKQALIIPRTTSGARKYIPMGFSESKDIISDTMNMIYEAPVYLFSILQSKMHMLWVFTISGYMGPSIRYSAELSYNTFPCPQINEEEEKALEKLAYDILDEREKFSDLSLDDLYESKKIPETLFKKHTEVDNMVDSLFKLKSSKDDYERLETLFKNYELLNSGKELF